MFKKKYDSLIGRIKYVADIGHRTYLIEWHLQTLSSTLEKVEEQGIEFSEMLEWKEYEWLRNEQLKEYLRSKDFDTFMVGVEILKQEGVL